MINKQRIKQLIRELLVEIGEDPTREGLLDTPARVANWWAEFIDYEPGKIDTAFETITADQLVVVSGIQVWSLCEHHLLPFRCELAIGYLTDNRVLGLSKLGRVAQLHAHKLQVQERLVADIAAQIGQLAGTQNVAVVAKGEHLCMSMRGIKLPAIMTTSAIEGAFRADHGLREEFMRLAFNGSMK